jgi:hypothetical protein
MEEVSAARYSGLKKALVFSLAFGKVVGVP